jgi:hypothetical protein
MKKITLLLVAFLFSWSLINKASDLFAADVDVKVGTPAGQVEVTNKPPSPPVIVVPAQPQKIVVEKEASPPPPSGGCHCSLVPSPVSASGFLSLAPVFFLLFLRRWKKVRGS